MTIACDREAAKSCRLWDECREMDYDSEKSGIKILVVDDHQLTRDMVGSILKGMGFTRLEQAEDGYLALQKLEDNEYDLIICDWNMPRMSGLEVLRNIRSRAKTKKLPFLMLTAEVYRENVVEAMKAGVTDYVSKPFTADVLGRKLEGILKDNK
jgi:two-component system chemotaxis response regulator CheY